MPIAAQAAIEKAMAARAADAGPEPARKRRAANLEKTGTAPEAKTEQTSWLKAAKSGEEDKIIEALEATVDATAGPRSTAAPR